MDAYNYIVESIKRDDEDLKVYVKELLTLNWIEDNSAAEGVAKLFVDSSSHKMTDKQIQALAKHAILPNFSECDICGEAEWHEMSFIEDNSVCSLCDHKLSE